MQSNGLAQLGQTVSQRNVGEHSVLGPGKIRGCLRHLEGSSSSDPISANSSRGSFSTTSRPHWQAWSPCIDWRLCGGIPEPRGKTWTVPAVSPSDSCLLAFAAELVG